MLLHDNARPHTAAHNTAETLRKLKFEVMTHPPYSPDLAPSDYHLFGPLRETLRDQEVKETVHAWFAAESKTFFSEGIRKLWKDGPSALKSKGTMLKNDVNIRFLFVLQ